MVRYLGLDYLALLKLERRRLFNQACLSVPESCDEVNSDQCLNKIQSPWREAKLDTTLLMGDSNPPVDQLFSELTSLKSCCLEPYGREGPGVRTFSSPYPDVQRTEEEIQSEDLGYLDEDLIVYGDENLILYGDFDLTDTGVTEEEVAKELYTEEFLTEAIHSVSDDVFEEIIVDIDPIAPHLVSPVTLLRSLQPLPLQDPLIQPKEEERCDFPKHSTLYDKNHKCPDEQFSKVDLYQENSMEVPLVTPEEFTYQEIFISSLHQFSPLPTDESLEDTTITNEAEDKSMLEDLVVDRRDTCSTSLELSNEPFEINLQCDREIICPGTEFCLESPLLPTTLCATFPTIGKLTPLPLTKISDFMLLSPGSLNHQLIQSDVNFDLRCVEKCRFSEPAMERVDYLHMERLHREWREVAVQKWNGWRVELNLSWNIHPTPEDRVDQNEAVIKYMNENKQRHIDDLETYYMKEFMELAPLNFCNVLHEDSEISGTEDADNKLTPLEHNRLIGCINHYNNPKNKQNKDRKSNDLLMDSLLYTVSNRIKYCEDNNEKDEYQSPVHTENWLQESRTEVPSVETQNLGGTRRSLQRITTPVTSKYGECISPVAKSIVKLKTPVTETLRGCRGPMAWTTVGLGTPVAQSPGVRSVSPETQSPKEYRTLRSLQDPFMESPPLTGIAVNKTQIQNEQCIANKEIQNQPIQHVQSVDEYCHQNTDLNRTRRPVSLKQRSKPTDSDKSIKDRLIPGPVSSGLNSNQTSGDYRSVKRADSQQASGADMYRSQSAQTSTIEKNCAGTQNDRRGAESSDALQKSPKTRPPKSRTKCIAYQLEGEYEQVVSLIAEYASFSIMALMNSGDLDKSTTFTSLTHDFTRFLLKEVTSQPQKPQFEERYRSCLALHTLCCAVEMLGVACLESCLELLSIIQEKYKNCLKGCLETLRQRLFSVKLRFDQERVLHPKIYHVCLSVHKKLTGEDTERLSHTKILMILSKDLDSLFSTLELSLQRVVKVKVCVQNTGDCQSILDKSRRTIVTQVSIVALGPVVCNITRHQAILTVATLEGLVSSFRSLDHCNCMLLLQDHIGSDFPWSQFSLIIEYEGDRFLQLCQRQNIKYIHFSYTPTPVMTGKSIPEVNMTIMCSNSVPESLVHLLESKYGVTCIFRNPGVGLTLPYIMIDEATCVVIYEVSVVGMDFSTLLSELSLLSQQFRDILIIASTQNFNQPQLKLRQHQQKLNFFLRQAVSKVPDLQYKVVASDSVPLTAEIVARFCQMVLSSDDQNWMSVSPSQEEQFLTSIPCINPIFAQKMLQILFLQAILDLHPDQLSRLFPDVPKRIIQMFYQGLKKIKLEGNVSEKEISSEPCEISPEIAPSPSTHAKEEFSSSQKKQVSNDQGCGTLKHMSNCHESGPKIRKDSDLVSTFFPPSNQADTRIDFVHAQRGVQEENSCCSEDFRKTYDRQAKEQRDEGHSGGYLSDCGEQTDVDMSYLLKVGKVKEKGQVEQSYNSRVNGSQDYLTRRKRSSNSFMQNLNEENFFCGRETLENVEPHSQINQISDNLRKDDWSVNFDDSIHQSLFIRNHHGLNSTDSCRHTNLYPSNTYTSGQTSPSLHCSDENSKDMREDIIQTSTENGPLEDEDYKINGGNFRDNLIATTRQLLKQATLSANDKIFQRAGPRRVSIGLARPLRQSQSFTVQQRQEVKQDGIYKNPTQLNRCRKPCQRRWTSRNSGDKPSKQGHCEPWFTSRGDLTLDYTSETNRGQVDRWPGYDSPPMDIEYDYSLQQDTDIVEDLYSCNKTSVGSNKRKLTYERVPNSKQSKIVFR